MDIIYPSDLESTLKKYNEKDHFKIKQSYIKLFTERYPFIYQEAEDDLKKDKLNQEQHNELLSLVLAPFLENKYFKNFELLYIEPLLYMKRMHRIEAIPILDFILAETDGNRLIRLILGEVKGFGPSSSFDLRLIYETYQKRDILNKVFTYIKKDSNLEFKVDEVKIEFVIVVDTYYIKEHTDSISSLNIKFNIWEIKKLDKRNKYKIIVNDWYKLLSKDSPYEDTEEWNYRSMINLLKSTEFPIKKDFSFTYATQPNVYLEEIYNYYTNMFEFEIKDDHLKTILNHIGGASFYDDESVLTNWVQKIKGKYKELNMIKNDSGIDFFKQKIKNLKDRIVKKIFSKKIKGKKGKRIMSDAIKISRPRRFTGPMDKFFKNG